MTYDSGQMVSYSYDSGGNITEVTASSEDVFIKSISFENESEQVKASEEFSLIVKANYSNGAATILTSELTFESSNNSIVTVDATGKIKGISYGTAIIKVEYGEFTADVSITVTDYIKATSVKINNGSLKFVSKGSSLNLTATIAPENTDDTLRWESADENKATVDQDGRVTVKTSGFVSIYAKAGDCTAAIILIAY